VDNDRKKIIIDFLSDYESIKDSSISIDVLIPEIVEFINEEIDQVFILDKDNIEIEDQLFDIIMNRFDILQKYRSGIITLSKEIRSTPKLAIIFYKSQIDAMQSILSIIYGDDLISTIKTNTLLMIYQYAFTVWERDKTEDLSLTMAALDKGIKMTKKLNIFAS